MPQTFDRFSYNLSYQPNWSTTWKADQACSCAPASYGGLIPYFDKDYYPSEFVDQNSGNAEFCVKKMYENPAAFSLTTSTAPCLNVKPSGVTGSTGAGTSNVGTGTSGSSTGTGTSNGSSGSGTNSVSTGTGSGTGTNLVVPNPNEPKPDPNPINPNSIVNGGKCTH